ncbi:MAG TPA: nucleoside monophosphate kinase [Patescibacteria group bacterium]|jgi:adenylate kinase|nr:nucleoside monophosphate kinase [Patescibacteria group bacterium]
MKRLGFDLILLGDPTAGKDTQAKILQKKYLLKPVESGKYWRKLAKKNNFEGRWLRRTMSMGYPTPVTLMKKFLQENLKNRPKNKDFIFVGNPRLKPEAQYLVKLLNAAHRNFFVLYLKIPVSEILKRTKSRRRLKTEDEGVRNRINYHKKQVSKTVAYFSSMRKLKFVDSMPPIPKVSANIEKILHDYQRSARN